MMIKLKCVWKCEKEMYELYLLLCIQVPVNLS